MVFYPCIFKSAFKIKSFIKCSVIFMNMHMIIEIACYNYRSVILSRAGLYEFCKLFILTWSCLDWTFTAVCICMKIVEININSVADINNRIYKAFRCKFIWTVWKNTAGIVPCYTCFVINRHILCEHVKSVTTRNSSCMICHIVETVHAVNKVVMITEIFLNSNNIKAVFWKIFTCCLLISSNIYTFERFKRKTCNIEIYCSDSIFFSIIIIIKLYIEIICKCFTVAFVDKFPVNLVIIPETLNIFIFKVVSV